MENDSDTALGKRCWESSNQQTTNHSLIQGRLQLDAQVVFVPRLHSTQQTRPLDYRYPWWQQTWKMCNNLAITKVLSYEIANTMHMHIIIVDNDATVCFDQMIELHNNLACLQHGADPKYIQLHAQTQKKLC